MEKETIIEALKDKDTSYVIVGFFSCPIDVNDKENSGHFATHFAQANINPLIAKIGLPEFKRQVNKMIEKLESEDGQRRLSDVTF